MLPDWFIYRTSLVNEVGMILRGISEDQEGKH